MFNFGIRAALDCYGWRVYLRGCRAPFDTHGQAELSAWALQNAYRRLRRIQKEQRS